ncbi:MULTISPECIES: hypothetical protein [Psychrobacillus]|uniref:Uncharacterized protein n=1 Tax=Psychrobacillus lasiicapitis TaxID=1636719 RepID=A0A544T1S3_9BACI|nr:MULTISPECIES: hypothetical protein [Psychrobacillus]MDI2586943.1 hypothetical protein [Psychrobacillus sp. NEAU-3TGS]TQR11405.1 hypothetical protein FG382_15785 [Psychrobacillus lasiicapitis]GGA40821.1 hypothetical protein GCM10011384_33100 [Psychrobacillus lasiicapitis]
MSKLRVVEIANEEAVKVFPEFEVTNPSYIAGAATNVSDKFFYLYGLATNDSDSSIRQLLSILLRDLRDSMDLKSTSGT